MVLLKCLKFFCYNINFSEFFIENTLNLRLPRVNKKKRRKNHTLESGNRVLQSVIDEFQTARHLLTTMTMSFWSFCQLILGANLFYYFWRWWILIFHFQLAHPMLLHYLAVWVSPSKGILGNLAIDGDCIVFKSLTTLSEVLDMTLVCIYSLSGEVVISEMEST